MVTISAIGIGAHTGFVMEVFATELRGDGYDITIHCADANTLDEDPVALHDFLCRVQVSDILFIQAHGDVSMFRHFDELRIVFEEHHVPTLVYGCEESVILQFRPFFTFPNEDYNFLKCLKTLGGDDNQRTTLHWCLNRFDGHTIPLAGPVKPLAQGVYAPNRGSLTLDEGLKEVGSTGKPVICILFVSTFHTRHNTDAFDVLYSSIEKAGGEPLAIFFHSYESEEYDSLGLTRIVDEYLIRDGKPIIDVILNTSGFSLTLLSQPGCGEQVSLDNFFKRLNVPIIQAINLWSTRKAWADSPFGLNAAEIAYMVVSPEYDGQIDTVPYCGTEIADNGDYRQVAILERCDALAEMACRWATLRHKPESEKKVAILIYMYPPRQDLAGGGYGLDTLQSVVGMLRYLRDAGYTLDWMPADSRELTDRLLAGVTNDDNWKSDAQLRDASVDLISKEQYEKWFSQIAESARKRFVEGWGMPPGDIHTVDGKQLIPGIMNGNIFIGFQPDRGKCTTESYHDPHSSPPHQYLGFYRWLRSPWGADAMVHVGTHGTLEWLPGKSVALSEECDPDIILGKIPNINPYIIDNPGEGMQSKRRQYAVTTTHMIPSMARSGGYEEINELETAIQMYLKTKDAINDEKTLSTMEKIISLCTEMNLLSDMGLSADCSVEDMDRNVDRIYDYLLEIKDSLIKDGLHILGEVPCGERLCEMIYSLVRYPNGNVPSLREAIAHYRGCDMTTLLKDPSGMNGEGVLNGELIDEIDHQTYSLICISDESGFDIEVTRKYATEKFPGAKEDLYEAIEFMCDFLIGAVHRMDDELINVIRALDGEYIEPGPSGCPGRGRAQILPTGRNFYSIDPDGIPWHSSWKIGSEMAEAMVRRYVTDNGAYPRGVGVILWATDTMKTGGDDVSYILRLMGLRPVWDSYGGRVKDLEVISLEELKRPRIDTTVRISGLFRDTFPNLTAIIDRGVQMIATLDEDEENNYLASNVRRDIVEAIASGIPIDRARRESTIRVFGDSPGQYGCGISELIATGDWNNVNDLGEAFVRDGCFVYGKGLRGEAKPELIRKRLKVIDVTVKNHNTRAVDMLDMDDDLDNLGGFTAAVTAISGKRPVAYMGDSSDMQNLRLRTDKEECKFIFRSKIDNPKWVNGLKQHGFAGAKELSKLFDYTVGWSGTSDIIDNWMYDDLAKRFVLDDDTREWIKDENPYAMMAMLARLEEAIKRGFWDAPDEMEEKLKSLYLEFEERIEEITDR